MTGGEGRKGMKKDGGSCRANAPSPPPLKVTFSSPSESCLLRCFSEDGYQTEETMRKSMLCLSMTDRERERRGRGKKEEERERRKGEGVREGRGEERGGEGGERRG